MYYLSVADWQPDFRISVEKAAWDWSTYFTLELIIALKAII